MPNKDWNLSYWNDQYGWPEHGEEWSRQWGSSRTQWWASILPRIASCVPAQTIVEIAPGQGRWSRYLLDLCDVYYGFDISPNTTKFCNDYLSTVGSAKKRTFATNSGSDFPGVAAASVDFVFSFDSLVHVEIDVLNGYLAEIARVLRPGGRAFLHHSNIGMYGITGDANVHCRGESVSAETVRKAASTHGLHTLVQEMISWHTEICQDCLTLLVAGPSASDTKVLYNDRFWSDAARLRQVFGPYHSRT